MPCRALEFHQHSYRFAFKSVQYFLYTDEAPLVSCDSSVKVLELANRLVLPRLISLVEQKVIEAMNAVIDKGGNVFQDALEILQPCQVTFSFSV